jgi:predicted metal-dependent enzyme (double-stranded beta helix superfamily)
MPDSLAACQTQSSHQNWLVGEDGHLQPLEVEAFPRPDFNIDSPYRLYRFLTELEDILAATTDDRKRLEAIAPRARHLLLSSYWLQLDYTEPPPDPGWAVRFLYREYQFPLTVQMVSWLPGHPSKIHNHGAWGIVIVIGGQEKNQLWRRSPTPDHPNRIERVAEVTLNPGDLIAFLPQAIHSIEPLGVEPAVTFNLYGVTDFSQRFQFNPVTHTAVAF